MFFKKDLGVIRVRPSSIEPLEDPKKGLLSFDVSKKHDWSVTPPLHSVLYHIGSILDVTTIQAFHCTISE